MAGIGAILCVAGVLMNPAEGLLGFFHAYLYAFIFWWGVTVGSLGLLMLHHVVGGGWGFTIRRHLKSAVSMLPLAAIPFLPVLAGLYGFGLYSWARPDMYSSDPHLAEILQVKGAYLNPTFFVGRAVVYFAIWMVLGRLMLTGGAVLYERDDPETANRLNVVGAFGILLYVLTVTFAIVDWVMSLTPGWNSSIFGLLTVASQGLASLALMLVLIAFLGGDLPLVRALPAFFRDLGNLTLAAVMLWGYLSFSQYVITYSGNTTEEVTWYVQRAHGGWGWVSLLLIPFHFFLPFLVLLIWSEGKRTPALLARVAAGIIFMRLVDLWWWVTPTFRPQFGVSLADLGTPLLLGGIWLWAWAQNMKDKPIVPLHDPRLEAHLHEVVSHA